MTAHAFSPMLRLRYADTSAAVSVTPGDLFGVWHEAETYTLAFDKLPAMLFQLADREYQLDCWRNEDGQLTVWAYSLEYRRRKGLL